MDVCTENRVLFFEENWNLEVEGLFQKQVICTESLFV